MHTDTGTGTGTGTGVDTGIDRHQEFVDEVLSIGREVTPLHIFPRDRS